jgi:MerR family transcriptional regulator, thiopeptide resistance regulator
MTMVTTADERARWRIGQVVRRTGLSERTLRLYEAEGLIDPPGRAPSGYRLYDARALTQIHEVLSLKALGWSLAQIAARDRKQSDPAALIARQIEQLRLHIGQQQQLLRRLEDVQQHLQTGDRQATTQTLLNAIEATRMYDKYFTEEQQQRLKARAAELGTDQIQASQDTWPKLIAQVSALRDAGTPAKDPRMVTLARQWMSLVQQFTGGDPAIAAQLRKMYESEPSAQQQFGVRPELMAYVQEALA